MDNDCGFVVEHGTRWEVLLDSGPTSIVAETPAALAEFIRKNGCDDATFLVRQYEGYWLNFTSIPAQSDNLGWQGPFSSAEYAIEVALDCLADPELAAADYIFASWEYEAA